jgi:hypothetical protein
MKKRGETKRGVRRGGAKPALKAAAPWAPRARASSAGSVVSLVRASQPRTPIAKASVLDDSRFTNVQYSTGRLNPWSLYPGGILPNPDEVLRGRAPGDVSYYRAMDQRHPWLAGIADQRVEKANKKRVIVAGDPSDARSREMALDMKRDFEAIPNLPVVSARWLRDGRIVCGYGFLENVWGRSSLTGNISVLRMIDRPAELGRYDDDGNLFFRTYGDPFRGIPVPRYKMSTLTGGSLNTKYGEAEYKHVDIATFWIEQVLEFGLEALQGFGRPIPTLYIPRNGLTKPEREEIKAAARAIHPRFLSVPTNDAQFKVEYPSNSMGASGNVGNAELRYIEIFIAWSYIRILRIVQTLNKTGGSRALEDTRYTITDDASRPDCGLLDAGFNEHFAKPYCDINYPDEPSELLPRFDTPTRSQTDLQAYHDQSMDLIDRGGRVSKKAYHNTMGIPEAEDDADVLGQPDVRATVPLAPRTSIPTSNPAPAEPQDDGNEQQQGAAA